MNTYDERRLLDIGLTPSDIGAQSLEELVRGSLLLKRQLRDEFVVANSHWRYQEFEPSIDLTRPDHWARYQRGDLRPIRKNEFVGRLLMTVGATDLWNQLIGNGSSTAYNATNAAIGVGDSTTAASAGQTDLQAAAGSGIQTSGFTSVSNATPIVIVNGSGNWTLTPAVGSVVVVSGITTETAADGTFEVSASSATSVTLLNSAGNGVAGALSSGVMKALNRYLQTVNGIPTVSSNQGIFVCVYGANNANFHAQEWCITNSAATTNKQAAPPAPHVFDRVVADNGTKAQGNSATMTATVSLS